MTRVDTSRPGRIGLLEATSICALSLLLQIGCDSAGTNSVQVLHVGGDTTDGAGKEAAVAEGHGTTTLSFEDIEVHRARRHSLLATAGLLVDL
jgi:hypothetical protein